MNISPFEAIGYYEFNRRKKHNETISQFDMVIFQIDNYSVGFCKCDQDGQITIVASKSLESKSSCIDDIDTAFQNASKKQDGFLECMNPYLDSFNVKMKMFYQSERQMNPNFKNMLTDADNLWSDTNFNEDECSIVIVGKAAMCYPIKHFIKEHFTFDPFLSDDRFVSDKYSDSADVIVNIGTEEYKKKKEQKQEIFIHIIGENQKQEKKKIPILDMVEENGNTKYMGPIFISMDEQLEFEVNSKKINVDIPYAINPLDCDLIEMGVCMIDSKPFVRIRRCNHSTKVYDIPIV